MAWGHVGPGWDVGSTREVPLSPPMGVSARFGRFGCEQLSLWCEYGRLVQSVPLKCCFRGWRPRPHRQNEPVPSSLLTVDDTAAAATNNKDEQRPTQACQFVLSAPQPKRKLAVSANVTQAVRAYLRLPSSRT